MRGYDAKSLARHLGLSVHTVNERLRDARRKLEVSSSREAARMLFETESADPQKYADKKIGEAGTDEVVEQSVIPGTGQRRTAAIAGVIIMSIFLGVLALTLAPDGAAPSATTNARPVDQPGSSLTTSESAAIRSARDWLVLGDQGRWKDGWLATGTSFRKLNTVERWSAVAEKVRVPLGALVSRTALSQESVPAPPDGVEIVKFRTSFANRADVIETVSLAREGSDWKVVGIYVDKALTEGAPLPPRANSHWRSAEVRLGGGTLSSRSTSISAIRALSGKPHSTAAASSATQKTGSRLIDVSCPAMVTDRLVGTP